MINVQIDEETLLNLFMDRLKYWADGDILALYKDYLENLIHCGCFNGVKLDISSIIDSLYSDSTVIMDGQELKDNYIDVDGIEVLAKNEDKNLYLVSSY